MPRRGIRELALLAASSRLETVVLRPHASHEPPCGGDKASARHTGQTKEREPRDGRGAKPLSGVLELEIWTLGESADRVKLLERLVSQEHLNPDACADLNAADRKGKTCALCLNPLNCI